MSLSVMSYSVSEDNGAVLVRVVLSGELQVDVTVSVDTRAGTGILIKLCTHSHSDLPLSLYSDGRRGLCRNIKRDHTEC